MNNRLLWVTEKWKQNHRNYLRKKKGVERLKCRIKRKRDIGSVWLAVNILSSCLFIAPFNKVQFLNILNYVAVFSLWLEDSSDNHERTTKLLRIPSRQTLLKYNWKADCWLCHPQLFLPDFCVYMIYLLYTYTYIFRFNYRRKVVITV